MNPKVARFVVRNYPKIFYICMNYLTNQGVLYTKDKGLTFWFAVVIFHEQVTINSKHFNCKINGKVIVGVTLLLHMVQLNVH